jgi:tetratricopeptide (TPR) repeat protein
MDARSDVWAVATVLFEMLTGKPYFEAEASSKLEWMIRNYRTLQPAIADLTPGLREILSRALDPDPARRFTSAAAFQAALHEWQTYGVSTPVTAKPADLEATRRTVYPDPDERTHRVENKPRPIVGPPPGPAFQFRIPPSIYHIVIPVMVAVFLCAVFTIVYEIRMYSNADALRTRIENGELTPDVATVAYQTLVSKSLFKWPLSPARNSLRDRYVAEADRVIADYREASESTPATMRDWRRAQHALNSAILIAPSDSIRGRSQLVDGFMKLRLGDLNTARADFEQARKLLPHSPEPHLGLAEIWMKQFELDHAKEELNEAKLNGFEPGRRENSKLADAYRARGEQWLREAKRAHGLAQMQNSLRKADSDLAQAFNLYNAVAPLFNGAQLADAVSAERDKAAKTLAQAAVVSNAADPPAEPRKETP